MSLRPLVLVVDDEPQIQRFLHHALIAAGYDIAPVADARSAMRAFDAQRPAVVLLDLGLPDMDGKLVIGHIRQSATTPIIVLSARSDEDEKIAALDLGATDFVTKPFGIGELLARIRAVLRAGGGEQRASRLEFGALAIDFDAHRVERDGVSVKLTPKEFDLLALLARHAGRVLTHRQLLQQVWGAAHTEDIAYLRVFIGQLRHKIERNPAEPRLLITETGIGYRLADEGGATPDG